MTFIHPTAVIYPNVTIGENVYIGAYSVIGAPAEHPELIDPRDQQEYGVYIGDNTIIRELVTINSGVENNTMIGRFVTIMSHAHVGHDANIFSHCTLHSSCVIGGYSLLDEWCRVGLGAVLHQRTTIIRGNMIGAQAFVKGTWAEPYRIIAGVPAKDIGENTRLIEKLKLR